MHKEPEAGVLSPLNNQEVSRVLHKWQTLHPTSHISPILENADHRHVHCEEAPHLLTHGRYLPDSESWPLTTSHSFCKTQESPMSKVGEKHALRYRKARRRMQGELRRTAAVRARACEQEQARARERVSVDYDVRHGA
jgi:hypothetical protein